MAPIAQTQRFACASSGPHKHRGGLFRRLADDRPCEAVIQRLPRECEVETIAGHPVDSRFSSPAHKRARSATIIGGESTVRSLT